MLLDKRQFEYLNTAVKKKTLFIKKRENDLTEWLVKKINASFNESFKTDLFQIYLYLNDIAWIQNIINTIFSFLYYILIAMLVDI